MDYIKSIFLFVPKNFVNKDICSIFNYHGGEIIEIVLFLMITYWANMESILKQMFFLMKHR